MEEQNESKDDVLSLVCPVPIKIADPPTVDLAGLRLRPVEFDDIPTWYEYRRRPHVVEHTSWTLAGESDLDTVDRGQVAAGSTVRPG